MKCLIPLAALLLSAIFTGAAEKKPGEAATLQSIEIKGDTKAGGKITAIIKVKLNQGYHTHSHKPSEPNFIATTLTVETPVGVKVGEITYPKGKSLRVAGLELPLSVYEKQFEISLPLTLDAKTALPVVIPATLRYQACQGAQCFPPERLKFDLPIRAKQ